MRVGLQTVHCSKNPGASLQAHALAKKISELGGDVEIINYCPIYFLDPMDPLKQRQWSLKEKLKAIINGHAQRERYRLFQNFNKKYLPRMTMRYNTPNDLETAELDYDVYICGSDQIWNPENVKHDTSFFFDYVTKNKAVLASYAASIGQDRLSMQDQEWIRKGIARFDNISIREKSGVDLACKLLHSGRIVQSIDPTLLFSGDYWRSVSQKPTENLPDHFILYYPIQNTDFSLDVIMRVKKETGLSCIALDGGIKKNPHASMQIRSYGPCEFLWLIDHADYIITNSFHGTVLSLLLKKQVIVYRHSTRNSRLESVLNLLDLNEIQISEIENLKKLNWKLVAEKENRIDKLLKEERRNAEEYLRSILEKKVDLSDNTKKSE